MEEIRGDKHNTLDLTSKPLRVLLVDDSENDAILLLRELKRGGYKPIYERVDTPEDMERVLREADRIDEPWQIVISDYYMPRFQGPDALALLRRLGYDTPFIVVSGKVGEDLAVEIMRAGAHDYIAKENMARLVPAVERELREADGQRQRKQAERERDRFFDLSLDLLCTAGLDGYFKRVNPAFEETLGYASEELFATPFVEFIHPEDRATTIREIEKLRTGASTVHFENRYRRKDSSYVWLSWKGIPVIEEGLVYAAARDISARKQAEEALRMSETRFRTVIEQSPQSIQILSPDGRTLQVNRAWEDLWGLVLEDVADYNILEDQQLVAKGIMPYIQRGFAGESTAIPAIGYDPEETIPGLSSHEEPTRWVQAFIYPVKDESGDIREVVLIHEDVTERKRAEEALRQSESSLSAAQRIAHLGSWDYDIGRDEAYWSDELYRIFGFAPQEFVPDYRTFLSLTHPDDRKRVRQEIRNALYGTGHSSVEYRIVRPDGEARFVNTQYEVVRDPSDRPVRLVGIIQDVTERKRVEEELVRLASFPRLNPNPVIETNTAGEPVYLNPVAEKLFPNLGELGERHPILADLGSISQGIEAADGRPHTREVQVNEKFYHQTISQVPSSDLLRLYAIDVTERRQAEEAINEIRDAERNRMARDLHDGVLQDLTYTTAAMEVTRIKAEGTGLEDELEQEIGDLRRAAGGLREAVYNLRLGDEQDRPLPRLLESLVQQNQQRMPGCKIGLSVEEEFPSIPLGETGTELLRIVQEALTNVRRHSEAQTALVRLKIEREKLVVEVSDDGCGFSMGGDSSGIGLKSMRERASALSGDLEVDSEPGGGTCVVVRVPLSY